MRLGPLCKGIKNAGPQRNAMSQSTELTTLVSFHFWAFLNLPTFIEFFSNAIGLFHNDITGLQFVRTFSIVGKRVH